MRIGVIGLGRMGRRIATRLAAAGHLITGYDRDPNAAAEFAPADSIASLVASSDAVLTVLPGTPEFLEVASALAEARLWIDLTSADPRTVASVAEGRRLVGAPMGGGPEDAEGGTLRLYVSGRTGDVAEARPLLDVLGTVVPIGERPGDGYVVKLLANLLWFEHSVAATEALLVGQALGLDPGALRAVLAESAGGSRYLTEHAPSLLDGDYLTDFGLDRVVEELDAITGIASQTGVAAEVAELVARLHREALAAYGPIPGELLASALLERRSGRTLTTKGSESEDPGPS
jgi:3-hydroxyisobutyrate dehydrogenase-like beta-hydroxyacid dehydrogenase